MSTCYIVSATAIMLVKYLRQPCDADNALKKKKKIPENIKLTFSENVLCLC